MTKFHPPPRKRKLSGQDQLPQSAAKAEVEPAPQDEEILPPVAVENVRPATVVDWRAHFGKGVPHEMTSETRRLVQSHAAVGTPRNLIAREVGISLQTLEVNYRDELDLGLARANLSVGANLFRIATSANANAVSAIVWWDKRNGISERSQQDHHIYVHTDQADLSFYAAKANSNGEATPQLEDLKS